MITFDKKPKKIIICGHEVKVRYRKNLKDCGTFSHDDNLIVIRNGDKWKEHLLHEIFHAIIQYSGQDELLIGEGKQEEALVRALENGFKTLCFV